MPLTRSKLLLVCVCLAGAIISSHPMAIAFENSVVVESKTVYPGQDSIWISVFVSNAVPVYIVIIPLEFRSVTTGTFTRPFVTMHSNLVGRIENSPLGRDDCDSPPSGSPYMARSGIPESLNSCSGPVSQTYRFLGGDSAFTSPDGYYIAADGTCYWETLSPGEDPSNPDSASIRFFLNGVTDTPGQFEIDTCCVYPASHLLFMDETQAFFTPSFVKGVITVSCNCSCHGDPSCDGITDVLDIIEVVDRAFRDASVSSDLSCSGHAQGVDGRTDIDCSGATDVIDVVMMIDVAIRGKTAESCNPCE